MQNKPGLSRSVLVAAVVFVNGLSAQELQPVLSTASAKAIVAGCEVYAEERGINVAIAVVGAGDVLFAFQRMDRVVPGAGDFAIWKATSSSNFGLSSKQLAAIVKESPELAALSKVATLEGGEPIYTRGGVLIGGVGVSGAIAAEDAECARAGIARAQLKFEKKAD